jgi:hypothetical protein
MNYYFPGWESQNAFKIRKKSANTLKKSKKHVILYPTSYLKNMKKILSLIGVLALFITSGFAQNDVSKPIVHNPVYFDVSPPLRDMVKYAPAKADNSWKDGIVLNRNTPYGESSYEQNKATGIDPNVQRWFGSVLTDTTIQNFDGCSNNAGVVPPDTYGEVGPNHYFQVVNLHYAIYNKSGSLLLTQNNSSIWSGMPNNSNDGDAVVVYDEIADRWLFSQFSLPNTNGPFYQMIAVSATADPTGSWYRYQYQFTSMGDYPKFGVWPDGYYMTVNRFSSSNGGSYQGIGAMAYDRSKMLTGDQSAQVVEFTLSAGNEAWAMLPSDCDGSFPPPGTPNYITYQANNHLRIYEFHVDWDTTGNSTFTNSITLPVNPYNGTVTGIPQKGTAITLDPISGRIMYRLQFRKFTDHWSMAASGTVNVGSNVAGIRWYELRNTGGGWSIYQQGTYAPDNNSRWMGSIAMDSLGDMALGYSISSSTMYPSIRFTGRFANDPLNEMTINEHGIYNGSGFENYSGTGNRRWGDYSGMSVDPSFANTFWYTQMYYATSGINWKSRVASFSFANIFHVILTANPPDICSGQSSQLNDAANGGSGSYTYSWTSVPAGFTSSIPNPMVTPAVPTQYICVTSDGSKSATDTVTVTVNSEPTANAGNDASYPNIYPLFQVVGTATSFSSIKWFTNGDGHFNIDTVLSTLYYPGPVDKNTGHVNLTLKAYPIGSCSDTASSTVHITLTFPDGIGENASTPFGFTLSPNPSNGIFTMTLTGLQNSEGIITISDLTGRSVYSEQGISGNNVTKEMNLSEIPKGTYIVKVTADQQIVTRKLVLQ